MSPLSAFIVGWFVFLTLIQVWMLYKLFQAFEPFTVPQSEEETYPPALAVLCLRGTDPFLTECLRRLSSMDYPSYTLRLVIDSELDPSLPIVNTFLAGGTACPVEVMFLGERGPYCSGKVSGMLRATEQLPTDCGVVAFFDGDTLVHPTCLRELVAPLRDARIGVTSGNRWYAPETAHFGAALRAAWNGFAMPLMNALGIPWGGCMAVRAEDIRGSELRHRMEYAFGEDSTVASHVHDRGLEVCFVSAAMIVNRETVSIKSFYNFFVRQLLTVRLQNKRWPFMLLHMLTLNTTLLVAFIGLFIPSPIWMASACGYVPLLCSVLILALCGRGLVRRSLALRGAALPPFSWTQALLTPLAIFWINQISLLVTVHSLFVREHRWRGIIYRLGGNPPTVVAHVEPMTTLDTACS